MPSAAATNETPDAAFVLSAQSPTKSPAPMPVAAPSATSKPSSSISESERRRFASLPLPRLPNLVSRERQASAAPTEPVALASTTSDPVDDGNSIGGNAMDSARAELARANDRAGLDKTQLARIDRIAVRLDTGDTDNALAQLKTLNDDLDAAAMHYLVKKGESLRQIAARPETFDNADLWPLIWRSNIKTLEQPWQVADGQRLQIPRYPSIAEVTSAIDYGQLHPDDGRRR